MKYYGDKICIISGSIFTKGNIFLSASLPVDEAVKKLDIKGNDIKAKIRDVALILRDEINNAEKRQLPDHLKIEDIQKGDIDKPELVELVFQNLIGGPDSRRWANNLKQIRTISISEDVAFAATGRLKKPQKHLMLGIALKSLTGSQKVVKIINRLGHCISYHTIEEIETEVMSESAKSNLFTPSDVKLDPHYGTGVAWDNFDRFVETVSGKDTLHDTVGIAYQTVITNDSNETEHNNTKISTSANSPN